MSKSLSRIGIAKIIIIHIIGWVLYFIINEFEPLTEGISRLVYYIYFFSYSLLACLFYFIWFYLNPKFLSKNRYWEYSLALIVLFFVYNFAREFQLYLLHVEYPYFVEIPSINMVPITFKGIMLRSFTYYIFHVPLFTCYFVWENSRNLEKENFEKDRLLLKKQEEIANLKTANIQSELSFLQSQINPHFLFNTLNSFYSKSVQLSSELAEGIEILSSIMRYAIAPYGQNNEKKEFVLMKDEILHIKNVIKIYKMRFSKIYLDFKLEEKIENVRIIPFVLITLVENVFKHGDLYDPEFPAKLILTFKNGILFFTTENKVRNGLKEPGTSIGLKNVLYRLQHTYGDKYSFNSKEKNGFFVTTLKIEIGNN